MKKSYKIIRVLTVAPVMALLAMIAFYLVKPEVFPSTRNFILSILCLTVLPLTAYPLQPLIPGFKDQGREGQRNLAIIMAVAGYLIGFLLTLILHAPAELKTIFLTYLISGVLVQFFTHILKVKASGHACGLSGPITLLVCFLGVKWLYAVLLIPIVVWVSYRSGRHTKGELIWGTLIGIFSVPLAWLIINGLPG